METPPMENRSRSDIDCSLAAVMTLWAARGFGVKSRIAQTANEPKVEPAARCYLFSRRHSFDCHPHRFEATALLPSHRPFDQRFLALCASGHEYLSKVPLICFCVALIWAVVARNMPPVADEFHGLMGTARLRLENQKSAKPMIRPKERTPKLTTVHLVLPRSCDHRTNALTGQP